MNLISSACMDYGGIRVLRILHGTVAPNFRGYARKSCQKSTERPMLYSVFMGIWKCLTRGGESGVVRLFIAQPSLDPFSRLRGNLSSMSTC